MTYLLLRDNKQSGPYSLEDLKIKGLKAYDLVWVEGKSAAWRYPSEITELVSFAPIVEEQPFDRFYKKPAAAAGSALSTPTPALSSGAGHSSQPFFTEEQSAATRKRTIYVTMPGATAAPVTVRETIREIPRETVRETVRPAVVPVPVEDYTFNEPIPAPSARNRDQIGELLPRTMRRQKTNILQPVLIGVGILVLLAGGIFIGLSINKDNPGLQKPGSRTASTDNSQPIDHNTAQRLQVPPVVTNAVTKSQTQPQQLQYSSSAPDHHLPNPATVDLTGKSSGMTTPKPKATLPKSQALQPLTTTDSSVSGMPVLRREAVHRTDPVENQEGGDKAALKVNLASQVSVGANKYEVGTFGGISNLQVTVSNRSAYPLDLVIVEVQYIQANKKTFKTENLYFRGIGPGMTLMQEAPKSSRGIKIESKITQINSKELGLSESGL